VTEVSKTDQDRLILALPPVEVRTKARLKRG
jgi:hypothetical protein